MSELTDAEIVSKIADRLIGEIGSPGIAPNTQEMETFYSVYCLDLEIGSGASFEQYFRWSSKEHVDRILNQLESVELHDLIESVSTAINVAFPEGIPSDPDVYEECTDWTEEQEERLEELYEKEDSIHALIEEKLAGYARRNDLLLQI